MTRDQDALPQDDAEVDAAAVATTPKHSVQASNASMSEAYEIPKSIANIEIEVTSANPAPPTPARRKITSRTKRSFRPSVIQPISAQRKPSYRRGDYSTDPEADPPRSAVVEHPIRPVVTNRHKRLPVATPTRASNTANTTTDKGTASNSKRTASTEKSTAFLPESWQRAIAASKQDMAFFATARAAQGGGAIVVVYEKEGQKVKMWEFGRVEQGWEGQEGVSRCWKE